MRIALASQSPPKVAAVRLAFHEVVSPDQIDIVSYKAPSGVNEQPIGDETLQGAQNRITFIRAADPGADIYVSIENGLFIEGDKYLDRAVVSLANAYGETTTTFSKGVIFPRQYVEETRGRKGGFTEWTVGKIMAEHGVVKDHADPHLDLSGKSRVEYLNEAARAAVAKLKFRK